MWRGSGNPGLRVLSFCFGLDAQADLMCGEKGAQRREGGPGASLVFCGSSEGDRCRLVQCLRVPEDTDMLSANKCLGMVAMKEDASSGTFDFSAILGCGQCQKSAFPTWPQYAMPPPHSR